MLPRGTWQRRIGAGLTGGGTSLAFMQRSPLRPENALTPGLLRRELLQLSAVAVVSLFALLFGVLQLVVGVVDFVVAVVTAVAVVVAWRVGGSRVAVAVYALAFVGFIALAVVNLRG
jgi:hypothetical protein